MDEIVGPCRPFSSCPPFVTSFVATSSALLPRTFAVTMNSPSARRCASSLSSISWMISRVPGRSNNAVRDATKHPCDSKTRPPSICFKLFSLSVVPEDTKSKMQSAAPIAGAASNAPSAVLSTTCVMPCSRKNCSARFMYAVTTRSGRSFVKRLSFIKSRSEFTSSHAFGTATARWHPPNPKASCTTTKSGSSLPISRNMSYPTIPMSTSPLISLRTTSVALWNHTSIPGTLGISAAYCRGLIFRTLSWQSARRSMVSSAMRPLEGMPMRMASRDSMGWRTTFVSPPRCWGMLATVTTRAGAARLGETLLNCVRPSARLAPRLGAVSGAKRAVADICVN
mmetsp:Transcript_15609/g.51242  ORF Transcript_15609/g.51242 Transcript_15609/m.51242 type:complete len:339 (-) Transcript_15609:59-1075(-)